MEKYIKYLLADIAAATQEEPVLAGFEEEEEEELVFLSLEEEEPSARREPLQKAVGLKQEWFPPVKMLSEPYIELILNALEDCLDAHGFIVVFPEHFPLPKQYELLVNYLDQEVPILTYNTWPIDFCNTQTGCCPLGEQYCHCKKYEDWLAEFDEDQTNEEEWEEIYGEEEDFDGDEDYEEDDEWENDELGDFYTFDPAEDFGADWLKNSGDNFLDLFDMDQEDNSKWN
ncbi:MAG TPA: hypothetical protein PKA00_08010 [Saprospiraceae bacterium]|mgnify:CR=1 FL=1|nr:hypothetical protein [Saprospiraceae bacterium]HMQ82837.1 hypothetical protein [Saprospiraceae bacterium]